MEDQIRVLVLGIRGEDHSSAPSGVGTHLESVIRSLHKPILVVNQTFKQPEQILLAYDGSDACAKAVQMLASSSVFSDLHCHIVHVGKKDDTFFDEAKTCLIKAGITITTHLLQGKIDEVLSVYQKQNHIDLIVMGAFSHHKVRDLLLGSFTAKMLGHTHCPLLLLR